MKKIVVILCVFLLISVSFFGCGKTELPEGITEDEVYALAEDIVNNFNEQNFAEMVELTREDVKANLSEEVLSQVYDAYIAALGDFTEFGNSTIKTATDSSNEETYISVVIVAKYDSGKLTYTINLDKNLEIIGFFFK